MKSSKIFNGIERQGPPDPQEVEVILIGPGYGECVLVHIGGGKWIVCDSCQFPGHDRPAAIEYLESIGVDPAEAVELIVISHWHDDHVRGIAHLTEICAGAKVVVSSAYAEDEFAAFVMSHSTRTMTRVPSGVNEIVSLLHSFQNRGPIKKALQDRLVYALEGEELPHDHPCQIFTLSPSDAEYDLFMERLASRVPSPGGRKMSVRSASRNHLAVVLLIKIGALSIVLGADLEVTADDDRGWDAVLSADSWKQARANCYKVAHHGSETGHHADVWSAMLSDSPFAIVAPFSKGRSPLPGSSDIRRIVGLTSNAYITAPPVKRTARKRIPAVERTIQETAGRLRLLESTRGAIRLRNATFDGAWSVDLIGEASRLDTIS